MPSEQVRQPLNVMEAIQRQVMQANDSYSLCYTLDSYAVRSAESGTYVSLKKTTPQLGHFFGHCLCPLARLALKNQ